ncbi:uncharacterized protein LOC103515328 [Diaphorina citri]|uniref:Uncharacterized protein LOC103515328 n=1 Tax=Diaphorina citri TaxID=121845 RepID=A0A3Q0J5W1_DIACI|nr:uncharacterized protein LOC103515328 [Diaphorina citri]
MWLWDQYRVHNELVNLNAIKHCLDKLTLLSDKAALILSHLSIIQAMLSVNTKGFIAQMSYLHYEWMVNLLRKERGKFDDVLIQILLKLSAYSKTHFELAKTSLVDQIISLIWPPLKVSATKTYQLVKILCALCKENLFRQKIIQTQHAVMALLTYLDMDVIEDTKEPMREENESNRTSVTNEMETSRDESMNEDTSFDTEETMSRTSKSSKADKPSSNLTNSIHYYILLCINAYQYDHEGLYRYLKANLIPILMKRLGGQIDKFEYRHGAAVCDQSKYLATRQSLSSGNMSPLSPNYSGNMSPNSSVSPFISSVSCCISPT